MADWRADLLRGGQLAAAGAPPRNPLGTPGYLPQRALRWGRGHLGRHEVVHLVWDFGVAGGSFGEADATTFCAAVDAAGASGTPVVSLVRSGGTRLQEGVAALVGMARATTALRRLAAAGVAHLAVADEPTTGGVFVTVVCRADLRIGVANATVGFAGPRVAATVTGHPLPAGSHRAESAFAAGLLDAVLPGPEVPGWLERALDVLAAAPGGARRPEPPAPRRPSVAVPPIRTGWEQVAAARSPHRTGAAAWLAGMLAPGAVTLGSADPAVAGWLGRFTADGRPLVAVALGTTPGRRPTAAGFALLTRAAGLAGRLGLALVTVVDTPGAEPGPAAEAAGIAPAIGTALDAVLACPAPTVGVLLGEGGSGGALAALTVDELLVGPDAYFAALVPEGAAVTLGCTKEAAAELQRLRPADLLALGVADELLDPAPSAATAQLTAALDRAEPARRLARWGSPVPGGPG